MVSCGQRERNLLLPCRETRVERRLNLEDISCCARLRQRGNTLRKTVPSRGEVRDSHSGERFGRLQTARPTSRSRHDLETRPADGSNKDGNKRPARKRRTREATSGPVDFPNGRNHWRGVTFFDPRDAPLMRCHCFLWLAGKQSLARPRLREEPRRPALFARRESGADVPAIDQGDSPDPPIHWLIHNSLERGSMIVRPSCR